MKITIRKIKNEELKKLDIRCARCNYWFDRNNEGLINALRGKSIIDFFKSGFYGRANNKDNTIDRFCRYGGRLQGAFDNSDCIGVVFYGRHYLFPRLRSFRVYPPDNDCIFIGCLYIKSGYRNMGVGQRLLMATERDLLKKKIRSIEIIGQRNTEGYGDKELVPVKFLIGNGFYIHKNDFKYPLLRLDLETIVKDFNLRKAVNNHIPLHKQIEAPGRYYSGSRSA